MHILTIGDVLTASDWACVQATCTTLRQLLLTHKVPTTVTIDARTIFASRHATLVTPTTALTPTQRATSLCRWLTCHRHAMLHLTIVNHEGDGGHVADEALYGGSPSYAAYYYRQAPSGKPRHDPLTRPLTASIGHLQSLTLHNTPCSSTMAAALADALSTSLTRLRVSCDRAYRGRRASPKSLAPLLAACTSLEQLDWLGVCMEWLGSTLAPQQHTRATVLHLNALPTLTTLNVDDAYMALGAVPPNVQQLNFR